MSEFNIDNILDNVKGTAKKVAKQISSKAEETVESAKISFGIKETENKISEFKTKMGDIIYEEYLKTKDFDGQIGELCVLIDNLQDDIEVMKDKLAEVKNEKRCKNCGAFNERGKTYCSGCGEKLEE